MRAVIVAAALLLPSVARADDQPALGDRGQYLLTNDTRLDIRDERWTDTDGTSHAHLTFDTTFAIDYVIASPVTIGATLGITTDTTDGLGTHDVHAGGRVGALVVLSPNVAVWPRAALTYVSEAIDFKNSGEATAVIVRLDLSAALVWRPVGRLLLGVAPLVSQDIYAAFGADYPISKETAFGVRGLIGGYFSSF